MRLIQTFGLGGGPHHEADTDIRLGWGPHHEADLDIKLRWEPHHEVDPDLRLEGQFNMFPSISHLFLRWRAPKSIAKLNGGMAG